MYSVLRVSHGVFQGASIRGTLDYPVLPIMSTYPGYPGILGIFGCRYLGYPEILSIFGYRYPGYPDILSISSSSKYPAYPAILGIFSWVFTVDSTLDTPNTQFICWISRVTYQLLR